MIKLAGIWLLVAAAVVVVVSGVAVGAWACKKLKEPPRRLPPIAQSPVDEELERERILAQITIRRPQAQWESEAASIDRWCVFGNEVCSPDLRDYVFWGECGREGVVVDADRQSMFFIFTPSVNVEMP